MSSFADRLREESEYLGLSRKELAYNADIKLRALAMYLGTQGSMPPADVAVRLAKALNVTVEYLVTGDGNTVQVIQKNEKNFSSSKSNIELDLERCSPKTRQFLEKTIHLFAENEKK